MLSFFHLELLYKIVHKVDCIVSRVCTYICGLAPSLTTGEGAVWRAQCLHGSPFSDLCAFWVLKVAFLPLTVLWER